MGHNCKPRRGWPGNFPKVTGLYLLYSTLTGMGGISQLLEGLIDDGPFEAAAPARPPLTDDRPYRVAPPEPIEAEDEAAEAAPAKNPNAEPIGFSRLRALLCDTRPFADDGNRKKAGRFVRKALHCADFEKAVLDPSTSAVWRLRQLCQLQAMAAACDLRHRDREETLVELDRAGMRILWAVRLVDTVLETRSPPENRAAALLYLIADGILPSGACAKSALEPAKQLLQTEDGMAALKNSPMVRDQILELLVAAERKPMV